MLTTDFTIIIIILNSLTFFALGYWLGRKNNYLNKRQEPLTIKNMEKLYNEVKQYETDPNIVLVPKSESVDEPSGVIYRPTAQELKKMNEDEATKQEKEAVAALFRQGAVT